MGLRFYFAVLYLAAILSLIIYLRSENNRMFYKFCTLEVQQNRLKQKLWQKQLQLENLINPTAVSTHIDN